MLGVQESADAISSTGIRTNIPGSGVNPSKVEVRAGQEFEITLTFSLQGRTRIRVAGDYQEDGTFTTATDLTDAANVDSGGYLINANGHRTLTSAGETYVGTFAETDYPLMARDPNGIYANPTTPYFSNSSRSVFDANGYPVYPYRAATPNTDPPVTEHRKSQVKALAAHWTKITPEKKLYYYDEEQITITPSAETLNLRLKGGHPIATTGTPLSEAIVGEAKPAYELTRSVTLVCSATVDGSFTVTNTTPNADYPVNAAERQRDADFPATDRLSKLVEFTVLVLPTPSVETNSFLSTSDKVVRLDELFLGDTATDSDATNGLLGVDLSGTSKTVVYEIIRGDGHLYTETNTTPFTQFTRHQDLKVYIDLNETDNEISAYVTGSFDGRKILPIRYTGIDRRAPGSNRGSDPAPPPAQIPRLTMTSSGEGTTRTVTVGALGTAGQAVSGISATLSGPTGVSFSPTTVTTGISATSTVTLPSTPNSYTIFATDASGIYQQGSTTIIIEEPPADGTLSITTVGAAVNGQQTVEVSARDANNALVGGVPVTLTGPGISRTVTTGSNGSVRAIIGVPTGNYTVTLTADGYTTRNVTLSSGASAQQPPGQQPPVTQPPVTTDSEPSRINISGPSTRSGTAGQPLEAPLLVQVLDGNGNPAAEVRVTFRGVPAGRGKLSDRGNQNAIIVETDANGYARADYTPIRDGVHTVTAEARGVSRRVAFTISVEPSPLAEPPGPDVRIPGDPILPVVHIDAARRPPMLWVDSGKIYVLVGAEVQEFASGVRSAMNVAIGGGKVYWTQGAGESGGTINSANLDGSNVKELKSILAVPRGIAVDVSNNKLYWTNSRGRVQSANADGSGSVENVLENLENLGDIALAGDNVYWTHRNGGVGFANLKGQKRIRNISNGADGAGSLVVAGGKLYWTQGAGESSGTINSANLNGSGVQQVASIQAVPSGIAVDTARSKLYWTNSRGRVQVAYLDGSNIRNVVDGLGYPGDLVLSNSLATPTTTTSTTTTPTKKDNAAYDVNGDDTVDNTDASLVAAAMNTTNAKYDVNEDGVVNFLDLLLVFDNRDAGAAGAPTIVGMKLTAVQVDTLQEQIDLLIATGDRSPAAIKTLIYLQQLIATARPEKTQLLANYPNPFNPETWIPYELATDTNVRIRIYTSTGVVVRELLLGHQTAGYYTGRDRAAYWDGRNAFGEQVASGVYFYQFETDDMSLMRKMVILK